MLKQEKYFYKPVEEKLRAYETEIIIPILP